MCRLFGFRSNVPSRAHRSLIEAENAIARQACRHSDGWGIGYYLGEEAYILKADAGAAEDERFVRLSSRLQSHAFVVHVRRATVGGSDYLNTHPFRHGAWLFAHNGTLFDFEQAHKEWMLQQTAPMLRDLIFGETDSEHLFYYLLSALIAAGLPEHGRARIDTDRATGALSHAIDRLYQQAGKAGVPPPLVNFILTNGRVFFAQRAGLELYLASQKLRCADYATCPAEKICFDVWRPVEMLTAARPPRGPFRRVNHLLVASEPIGNEDLWEEIPDGMLVVLDEEMRLHLHAPPPGYSRCPSPPAPPPRPGLARSVGQSPRAEGAPSQQPVIPPGSPTPAR